MNPPAINNTVTHLRAYARVMAFKTIGRRRRKAKEREERGTTHGRPLSFEVRADIYMRQNNGGALTPRQQRRVVKKARKGVGVQ